MPWDFPKGMQDATGGASVHINRSPYQQAAPVLLNWRSSPRPDGARLLGKLRRRDRAAESLNTPMHLAESARQEEKLDERPVGHRWTWLWPAGLVLATFCMCSMSALRWVAMTCRRGSL